MKENDIVIYLKHKVHGTKVAISEDEAKADEKNGWERFSLGSPRVAEEVVVEPASDLEKARAEYKEKTGKAPHHKKSLETLKQELAA